jgi:hypothetical protein
MRSAVVTFQVVSEQAIKACDGKKKKGNEVSVNSILYMSRSTICRR